MGTNQGMGSNANMNELQDLLSSNQQGFRGFQQIKDS